MKCDNHPNRAATTRCYSCKSALCDECSVPLDDGRLMCDRCSLLTILQERHKDAKEKIKTKRKQQDVSAAHKKRLSYFRKWSPVFGLLLLGLIGAMYFANLPVIVTETVDLTEHPDAMMLVIDQAIRDFAADNEGYIPNSLSELIGGYLPPRLIKPKDLDQFVYVTKSDNAYRIWPKHPDQSSIPDLVVTENGLELKDAP